MGEGEHGNFQLLEMVGVICSEKALSGDEVQVSAASINPISLVIAKFRFWQRVNGYVNGSNGMIYSETRILMSL